MASKLKLIIQLIPKLGLLNILYVICYKGLLKVGLLKRRFRITNIINGPFFTDSAPCPNFPEEWKTKLFNESDAIMSGKFTWFSYHQFQLNPIPNWFLNPFEQIHFKSTKKHWTELKDFGHSSGDIKIIWELSRWDWLPVLSRAYKVSGRQAYLQRINDLLADWVKHNPTNQGPNWKCGQEASFRVMKLMQVAHILDQFKTPTKSLLSLVSQHLMRIKPTVGYAIAQKNNHATSELSVLYIANLWLTQHGKNTKKHLKNAKKYGKKFFQTVISLTEVDGSFAQRSLTYHRVLVDTISFVIHMRNLLDEPALSDKVLERLEKIGLWQYKMTFGSDGDGPNYGSNDGALVDKFSSTDYRDFRPSTQTFFGLLTNEIVFKNSTHNESLFWKIDLNYTSFPHKRINLRNLEVLDDHLCIMRVGDIRLSLIIPSAKFRPGNDPFHIDLWHQGKNILRDNGTYSYNHPTKTNLYKSITSHNTLCFNNKEPMPRVGRFLNGAWIKANYRINSPNKDHGVSVIGSYTDYKGRSHQREVKLNHKRLEVIDTFSNDSNPIIYYHFNDSKFQSNIETSANQSLNWKQSWQSLYYMQESPKPCVCIDPENSYFKFIINF